MIEQRLSILNQLLSIMFIEQLLSTLERGHSCECSRFLEHRGAHFNGKLHSRAFLRVSSALLNLEHD
jgi:hypothetical protein